MKQKYDLGKTTEYRFAWTVLEKGLNVSWPCSERLPYDFIVENGLDLYKIQVKSTESLYQKEQCYLIHNLSKNVEYKISDFDFLVAYIADLDTWYVFPHDVIHGRKLIRIYPRRRKRSKRYEDLKKYKEAWNLLKESKNETNP